LASAAAIGAVLSRLRRAVAAGSRLCVLVVAVAAVLLLHEARFQVRSAMLTARIGHRLVLARVALLRSTAQLGLPLLRIGDRRVLTLGSGWAFAHCLLELPVVALLGLASRCQRTCRRCGGETDVQLRALVAPKTPTAISVLQRLGLPACVQTPLGAHTSAVRVLELACPRCGSHFLAVHALTLGRRVRLQTLVSWATIDETGAGRLMRGVDGHCAADGIESTGLSGSDMA